MILPQAIQNTIDRLEQCGFEAYAVGGAVRDFLLNLSPKDWDIATSALPQNVIDIFGEKNCIPTGIKHGTITLVKDAQMIEITTYRVDGEYGDNRHPDRVVFSKSITEDLSRRDFTINAMAYAPKVGIVDLFGGQKDLAAKIIRTVSTPEKRFSEDGLRIIRGLRFGAVLGFDIEENTKLAMHQCKSLLGNIARERLQSELSKLVLADRPEEILTEFSDVFAEFLGIKTEFCPNKWSENAKLLGSCPLNLPLRLAILLDKAASNTPPHKILRELKYDNKTIYTAKIISNYIDKEILPEPICIKHILSELGENTLRLVLEAKRVKNRDIAVIYNIMEKIISSNQCCKLKDLKIDGNDLIHLGISGKEIGRILKSLLNEVIEERCENKRSALIELAERLKRLLMEEGPSHDD